MLTSIQEECVHLVVIVSKMYSAGKMISKNWNIALTIFNGYFQIIKKIDIIVVAMP